MASITKKSEGKYLIRVSKGTGKRRQWVNVTFRGKLKDAKIEARKQETLIDSGRAVQSVYTFERYFELWLKAVKPRLAPRTHDGYDKYIRRYAFDKLKELKLAEIRTLHIQAIYANVDKSPTTVRNLHAALRACFAYAVKKDYLNTNPCKNADLPARQRCEITVLDAAEAATFSKVCREKPHGTIFAFALETGMRPEEYLALRWRDITGNDVSVSQAVQFNTKGGGYYFKELKTARSRRRIPISETLRLELVRHRREQNEHRLKMKTTWFNHDLVFPNEIGRPHTISNITRRYFKPILETIWPPVEDADGRKSPAPGSKHITLYALRHSCATLLLMHGTNPKVVADRLGHASVVMTLDTYSHVLPHIQEEATDAMERIMKGAG